MNNIHTRSWCRTIVRVLALQLALGPLATPAFAQATKLADEPIGFTPSAPPNIMLTVDDSTSMLSDFLPDYVISDPDYPGSNFCRDATGNMTLPCGNSGSPTSPPYIYSAGNTTGAPNVPYPRYAVGTPAYSASSIPDWLRAWPAPAHSNALNRLYYDPSITYLPPLNFDGTPFPSQDKTVTVNWTSVMTDPWVPVASRKYENLTTTVKVGMWCNSDWPTNTDPDPTAGGGLGGGNECRVNGTNYTGVAPTDAAVSYTDYLYPWQKSSGADSSKYFYRGASGLGNTWTKPLYCDTTHPKYPKSCTTNMVCPVATVPATPQPQTCFFQSNQTGCVGPVTYSPAGCNVVTPGTKFGAPGCTAAGCCTGSECIPCNVIACPTGITGKNGRCRLTGTAAPGSGGSNAACNCSGAGCTLPSCPNFTPQTCPVALVPRTTCSNTSPACTDKLHDPVLKTNTGIRLIDDANGAGEVCRHNNQAYPDGTVAAPFNYPSGKYTQVRTGSCPTVPGSATVPRHYWRASVEWCSSKITTANDKWRGFGLAGTCQNEHDSAHPYPRYYKWGARNGRLPQVVADPEYLDNYLYPAFERIDLVSGSTYNHDHYNAVGQFVPLSRTYEQEMENYANWFAYYRTRIQAAKTVISQNFTYLDSGYRVGFHTLSNSPPTSFVDISEFDHPPSSGGQKDKWYQQLFAIQIAMGKQTPNIDAVVRIGELFKNGSNPALSGSSDPIVLSCHKNYHMLFTDGITNQSALPATLVGNVDNTVPALPQAIVTSPAIVAGSPWPNLYRENAGAALANTMSDYTTHYWVTDLRPGMQNNVVASGADPAPWQHLNFAALSLGTEGVLAGASPSAVEALIERGLPADPKWPTPTPNSWQPNATGVDDLWHAAVNARGRFVNAKTSQQLGRGIAQILQDITSASGSGASPTFANPTLSVTNDFTWIAMFEPGWGGDVQKVQIDPVTAQSQTVLWSAKTALIAQTTPGPGKPTPWYTERRIVTLNEAGVAVPFVQASLGPTQLATLGADSATQDRVIEYLRGRRDNEGDGDGQYRKRPSPLGDIVDSQAAMVGKTDPPVNDYWDYIEANDPGYAAFKDANKNRPTRVYVGANDGMLHVFDDADGREAWAFIPRDFFRGPPNDKAGLVGLTYQPGGLPIYDHRFYVNASPRVVDANLNGTWKTLLVSGLGKGGKSYFAIDATNPTTVTDEASAASKFLWDFRDPDLGFTYGRATIVKTRAFGGQWLVVVPSGYNNASGEGKLFFLRASDGVLLHTMSTSVGAPGSPSGLAHITGYTKDYRNQLAEQFYAGDLFGNLWRFDTSDANVANWKVEKLAELRDPGGAPQPVTTPVRIDVDVTNGVDRWVFVGTGKLTHQCDLTDYAANPANAVECTGNPSPTQQQSMYAIRDGTYIKPSTIAAAVTRADLDVLAPGVTGLGANVIAKKGWINDLPPGQRMVRTPVATVGLIAYIATSQPLDPCEIGLPANIYVRQFGNGESRLESGGTFVESIYEPTGAAGLEIIAVNPPGCTSDCVPDIKLAVLSSSKSELITFSAKLPSILGSARLSWRTLGQ
jgi:type IV pilus assembly protein PilY1